MVLKDAEQKRREAATRLAKSKPIKRAVRPVAIVEATKPALAATEPRSPPELVPQVRDSLVALFQDGETMPSEPSSALLGLADLYLHAAKHRSRHIAMVWPASLKTLTLVHAVATIARWHEGDKQGVRGLFFPAKTNVFHPLNHIHVARTTILRLANEFVEVSPNARVTRGLPDKDAFLYSLSDRSLPNVEGEPFNPSLGELLPHFLATPEFAAWRPCDDHLLAQIRAKLLRRAHAKALQQLNCAVIGAPKTAPDAIFALDGRMSEDELRKACRALAKVSPPEVVLVAATRVVRSEALGWKARLSRFCLMLEETFHEKPPGVVVVTDEPHTAYRLKNELWERNHKREPGARWRSPHEYKISGFPSVVDGVGLHPAGVREANHPAPREFDVHLVDADMAKVTNKLVRIADTVPGGKTAAVPLVEASAYLSRIAALPCGVRHMSQHLSGPDVSDRTRTAFDWPARMGAVRAFEKDVGVGENRPALEECLTRASKLFENYYEATPFAHKLASLAATAAVGKRRRIAIVFTSALYRRLAELFLSQYSQYPDNIRFEDFRDRVQLLAARQLEEHLDKLDGMTLVFAGLNEDCLRLLVTDDRVTAHSVLLLTQRTGQFLRASLKPIVESFPEFKAFKPRLESVLRQLKDLPEDSSVLSTADYILPTFRVELSSEISSNEHQTASDCWAIQLANGTTLFRRDSSEVYVYDPDSQYASDSGFRVGQVKSLEAGNKLFVMSGELREMVEQELRDAGVPIQSDKTFEAALRNYHEQVQKRLAIQFPIGSLADKVRAVREQMLAVAPGLVTELPKEQAMRHWIDLGASSNTPFEKLRPSAPLREAAFKAFAQVLGFSALETAYQWQRVILAVRNSRRLDGRHVSDIYAYMLLQPESAMANSSIRRKTLAMLFARARESVATVEQVGPFKEVRQ
ncbi:hypothetical protein B0G81_5025 [Paraburkholderia sp. BL6665CI2N2]|nr:hypothetical protein B0G81_5025 [Paraburkholderia sp. BL6665CI2N2]